jgi:hypothetical protein
MEVVFGVQGIDRSIKVDLPEDEVAALRKRLEEVFSEGATGQIVWITDGDGRVLGVPVDKLAYIELGADRAGRRVGFDAAD